jgi:organic radical activating enzyme
VEKRFIKTTMSELPSLIKSHGDVCITGGEPLMPEHRDVVIEIIQMCKTNRVFVYTNGLYFNATDDRIDDIGQYIDGFTVGLHAWLGEKAIKNIMADGIARFGAEKCFFRIEDKFESMLLQGYNYETWKMNECDTDEDIYLLEL